MGNRCIAGGDDELGSSAGAYARASIVLHAEVEEEDEDDYQEEKVHRGHHYLDVNITRHRQATNLSFPSSIPFVSAISAVRKLKKKRANFGVFEGARKRETFQRFGMAANGGRVIYEGERRERKQRPKR